MMSLISIETHGRTVEASDRPLQCSSLRDARLALCLFNHVVYDVAVLMLGLNMRFASALTLRYAGRPVE